jgi:hypothetical protein
MLKEALARIGVLGPTLRANPSVFLVVPELTNSKDVANLFFPMIRF